MLAGSGRSTTSEEDLGPTLRASRVRKWRQPAPGGSGATDVPNSWRAKAVNCRPSPDCVEISRPSRVARLISS